MERISKYGFRLADAPNEDVIYHNDLNVIANYLKRVVNNLPTLTLKERVAFERVNGFTQRILSQEGEK